MGLKYVTTTTNRNGNGQCATNDITSRKEFSKPTVLNWHGMYYCDVCHKKNYIS